MKKLFIFIVVLGLGGAASGTTYFVSSSTGSDSNAGTSSGAAWQTIAHVNAQTFAAGDSILFKRGDVWNDARNSSKRDVEIETTRTRVTNLERVAEVNTEGRIRTEVQLLELRAGQAEIKALIEAQAIANKKALPPK